MITTVLMLLVAFQDATTYKVQIKNVNVSFEVTLEPFIPTPDPLPIPDPVPNPDPDPDPVPPAETGWTVLEPSADSRQIFVSSSSGDDMNDGLTEATPKRTVAAGLKLLRNQQPDWLRLKAGDVFLPEGDWRIETTGGPAADKKTVITSYGEGARPVLKNGRMWYGSSTKPLTHFAMVGLDFYASYRDPDSPDYQQGSAGAMAAQFLVSDAAATGSDDWLFENNRFRYYVSNVQINGSLTSAIPTTLKNVTFRRNVVIDAEEFGLQLYNTTNGIIEENVFERNGWKNRTVQLHNVYVSTAANLRVTNNIFSRGGNMSIKISGNKKSSITDFVIENNVFYRGMVGFGHGSIDGSWNTQTEYSHERGVVRNNVTMKTAKNIPVSIPTAFQSIGFNVGNLNDVLFESNIFAHNDEIKSGGQVFFFADPSVERSNNLTLRNNVVWNWLSTQFDQTGSYMYNANFVGNLVEQNNLPIDATYSGPSRTLGKYNVTLGGTDSDDAFLTRACELQKGNWDTRYTADEFNKYMRAGFGLTP